MSKSNSGGNKPATSTVKIVAPTRGEIKGGQIPTSRNPPPPPKGK